MQWFSERCRIVAANGDAHVTPFELCGKVFDSSSSEAEAPVA